ncbi:ATPase [Acinetobacter kyonggiensis]|uniref:Activator of Hsp90 ATPase homolog 1-like protein n=1 Tax=Acinetobacter kyonggiensis TaxID=595670 RepID=A0A1H3IVY2_9GAMM|nr:ATPase [Acinetobacter kyonggiensis]SDY31896.1 hypothetical protein SAMN05421643_107128 [Acinetobacter kyonggiensis]
MEILKYEILIAATPQKVWQVLWNPETYMQWTQYFSLGSTMHSDWTVHGKTVFLDASGAGMVSTMSQLEEFKLVVFKHLGLVQGGIEDLDSDEVKKWRGALEKYFFEDLNGTTKLKVELETAQEYLEMMDVAFKKGFE